MKIFVTGGTGFVGGYITAGLARRGHEVTILTRSGKRGAGPTETGISFVQGDPQRPGGWQDGVAEHDAVINLAGSSIFTLWTRKAKREILDSRVLTTRNVVDALSSHSKEALLINGSAVGYYGGWDDDRTLDEASPPGTDFLALVAKSWEAEAVRAEASGVRVVLCRFGIVLGKGGGALDKMLSPFNHWLGSPLGSGRQWFPWVHIDDLLRIILFVCDKKSISGPVNCTAPSPVRNRELTESLAQVLRKPLIMPSVPGFVLKGILGEFGDVLLKGQRVVPKKLLDAGYGFRFPIIREALRDLVG